VHRHDLLEKEMNNIISGEAPHLEDELSAANDYWRNNVANWYSDKNLFRIVKGREKNPSSSTLAGIFRNPEPEMLKVANEIGEEGQKGILLHGIGKARGNYSSKNLENIVPKLEEKGLLPYVSDEFHRKIGDLNQQIQNEKRLSDAILAHEKQVKSARRENKQKLSSYEKEASEHQKRKEMQDRLIEQLTNAEPSAKALPNYQSGKLSYPIAQSESEKIVAKAGEKHEKLQEQLRKYLETQAENKRRAAEHAAAIAAGIVSPKLFLTGYKTAKVGLKGIGKITKAIRSK